MADTATYRPIQCYQCGETMRAYTFKDVWKMRIDGVPHQVPIYAVPCHRCDACDLAVTDGGSDEVIHYCYVQYCRQHGLWTPWRRFCRWVRSRARRVHDRYWWWRTRHLRA